VRGGRLVFDQVSFALSPGEAMLLKGPNGAGKSTLLRVLAGFLAPASGHLSWRGQPVGEDPAEHRARLHLIGHGNGLKNALTARENLRFAIAVAGAPADHIDPALDAFDLGGLAEVPALYLSAGQKRRLALARLLGAARPVWLLDEPDAGLDVAHRAHLMRAVAGHRDGGGIAVIATHGDLALATPHVLELAA
jgi:heme exporter protein A